MFARHNVLIEPPFSRIDLISCRNMLITSSRCSAEGHGHDAVRSEATRVLG